MKSRLNLIAAALVVLLGSMVWVVKERATPVPAPALAAAPIAATRAELAAAPVALAVAPAPVAPATPAAPLSPQREPAPMVSIDSAGGATYVARDGDTVSQLASALLGSDSKEHRDAVVRANASLRSNPDRVLTGQAYSIGASSAPAAGDVDDQQRDAAPVAAAAVTASATESAPGVKRVSADEPMEAAIVAKGPKLRYTAQTGDTVRALASDFLGGDTQLNRDAIIQGNPSLQKDPDHLVAGKSYSIVARNGLSADANAPQARTPTTQPDADEVARLSGGRALRYTAVAGDTVSKLALALLGSDTAANRELIIQSNPSLKLDPDHLSAGQTYWIPAPMVDSAK